jgi:hypothetical protein
VLVDPVLTSASLIDERCGFFNLVCESRVLEEMPLGVRW